MEAEESAAAVSDDVMAVAVAQAEKDIALLEQLNAKRAEAKAEQEPITITTDDPDLMERKPMNRAERRQQVKLYAMLLRETEKQQPIVNPTIVPKAARRRKKGGRRA